MAWRVPIGRERRIVVMRVVIKVGEALMADLAFEEEEILIGSEAVCSIHLPHPSVSLRQARVMPSAGGAWLIENLDDGAVPLLNELPLAGRVPLHDGDELVVHDYLLKFHPDAELDDEATEYLEPQLDADELAKIKKFPLPPGAMVRRHFDNLSLTNAQLYQAARITLDIAECRDIHELIEVVLEQVLERLRGRAAWIGIRRQPEGELEVEGGRLVSGQPCETNPILELIQYRCVERGQALCVRKVRGHDVIGSALGVPLAVAGGVLGMLYVDRQRRQRRLQLNDLDMLGVMASYIAVKVEAIVHERAQRSAAVLDAEVGVVHEIQAKLDPKTAPTWDNLQLAAYSRSGQENPGDVYDIMKHPDLNVGALVLGHINATGSSLALSMARLHSVFRVGFLHKDRPQALARALCWLIHDERDPSTVDALFLMFDPVSGKIEYARGGKIGAFIVNNRGEPRPLQGAEGPAIGEASEFEYGASVELLSPGETLALYTRGVASSMNAAGERFGELRFIELVCDGFGDTPTTIIQDVASDLTRYFANGRHPDDITILLLHRSQA